MGGALNIENHVEISPLFEQHVRRLRTTGTAFRVHFHNLGNIGDVHQFLLAAIQYLLDRAFDGASPADRVGVEIRFVARFYSNVFLFVHIFVLIAATQVWTDRFCSDFVSFDSRTRWLS